MDAPNITIADQLLTLIDAMTSHRSDTVLGGNALLLAEPPTARLMVGGRVGCRYAEQSAASAVLWNSSVLQFRLHPPDPMPSANRSLSRRADALPHPKDATGPYPDSRLHQFAVPS